MNIAQPAPIVKPWYREPWPWILMAGPFVAMIGCFITIYFAYTQFSTQPILDGVVKRGLVIEQTAPKAADGAAAASAVRVNP
ncbi:FixH family protein [Achromobacter seleniivolatilans]|uniref:FixH family protein n=1 Tax=Achromobacter seleniivolatilans TaxID=3047478 RepID=A0ABY9M2B5_9BURK|nr:FixH family protein [Achromobacter sp. R39]WMD21146.1 FixH family protein [Achromobacter sp. R39]